MLRELCNLARREDLLGDPDFDPKGRVDFVVRLDAAGRYLGLDSIEKGRTYRVPRQGAHSIAVQANYLVDNARYVLGVSGGASTPRDQQCAAAFRNRVAQVARDSGEPALTAVLAFLAVPRSAVFTERPASQWTGGEVVAFRVEPDDVTLVHERPLVEAHWRKLRASADAPAEGQSLVQCLVTGDLCVPVRLHKGIPLGGANALVVSYNAPSFLSHGLSREEIAPISRRAVDEYTSALRWLMEPTRGRFQPRQGILLGKSSVLLFWTQATHSVEGAVPQILDPVCDEDRIDQIAQGVVLGKSSELDITPFYAVVLVGNQARVIIREWMATTAGSVQANLARYHEDLRVERDSRAVSLYRLLESVGLEKGSPVYVAMAAAILRAALTGDSVPRRVLRDAIHRYWTSNKKGSAGWFDPALLALVKIILNRLPSGRSKELPVSLDEERNDPPYLLGRLFAVLLSIQEAGNPGMRATIRDRFRAAPATPARVFPVLLRLSWTHEDRAYASDLRRKELLLGRLSEFPRRLDLEDQGVFMLGYAQQKAQIVREIMQIAAEKKQRHEKQTTKTS